MVTNPSSWGRRVMPMMLRLAIARESAVAHAAAWLEGRTSRGQRGCAVDVLGYHQGVATEPGLSIEAARRPRGDHCVPGVDTAVAQALEPGLPRPSGLGPGWWSLGTRYVNKNLATVASSVLRLA